MDRPRWIAALTTGVLVFAMSAVSAPGAQAAPERASGRPTASAAQGVTRQGTGRLSAGLRALLHHRRPDPLRPTSPTTKVEGDAAHAAGPERTVRLATNWSGEVELGSGLTSVGGTWTVPRLAPTTSLGLAATWIGIGGLSGTTLVQTGTVEATGTGQVGYAAWVEILPTPSWTLTLPTTPGGSASFLVAPGDTVHAAVTETGTDLWQVSIEDVTAHWSYSHLFSYVVSADSAEWITERPTLATPTTGATVLATLADYGSTRFTDLATATGGVAAAPSPLTPVRMIDDGNVISSPGQVSPASSPTGESFTDSYLRVPSRVYGPTPDATAAAELEHQFAYGAGVCPTSPTSGRAVVLATDKTYADALASAYLAGYLGTGTLLTPPTSVSAPTLAAIRDEGITHVFVVGGDLAVGPGVVSQLQSTPVYACGGTNLAPGSPSVQVTRLSGSTAYETAFVVATSPGPKAASVDLAGAYGGMNGAGGDGTYNVTSGMASTVAPAGALTTAILATGTGFQDAASASTLAYAGHLPVLLTAPATLSGPALAAIEDLHVRQVVAMGGPLAVSDAVVSALEAHGVSVLRVAGSDGTETAIELAKCELASAGAHAGLGWRGTGGVTVARGDFFGDGLAGAVVAADGPAATTPEPLLLTASPTSAGGYLPAFLGSAGTAGLGGTKVDDLTILGGPLALSQTLANTLVVSLLG